MSDFTIKLNAELDLKNIKQQIENLDNVSLELTKISVDTDKISKSITKAFNKSYTVKIDTSSITKQIESAVRGGLNTTSGGKIPKSTSPSMDIDKYLAKVEKNAKKINRRIVDNTYYANIQALQHNLNSYSALNKTDDFRKVQTAITKVNEAYDNLSRARENFAKGSVDIKGFTSAFENFDIAMGKASNEMKIFNAAQKETVSKKTIATTQRSYATLLKNNTKLSRIYTDDVKGLNLALEKFVATGSKADKAIFDKGVEDLKLKATKDGNMGMSTLDNIKRGFKQIGRFVGTYGIYQRALDTARQSIQYVVEIDSAMTDLKKVTDETDLAYSNFLDNAGSKAKQLGSTMTSFINQTATWSKLGYSMSQASDLATTSMIYSNVGEVDDSTAVSDLVTVLKAYDMRADQSINIVDELNELGNSYATSAADLGTGLKNVASTMSMAGVSLEQTLGILTGGTEITQNAGEFANAVKVSVLRLRGQKGALEELGEYADDVESVSKMQTQILNLTKGAVNIMDSADPTQFRNYYDVMADIAKVLPTLQETDQADLIETLFGKVRANQGQAMLQAFQSGQIQKAYQTAMNSEGSALKEHSRWLDSIEAKTNQFKAAWQELSTTTIDSDFAKGIVDAGTLIISILNEVIDHIGVFNAAIGGLAIFKLSRGGKPKGFLNEISQNKFIQECATSPFSREVYESAA